MGGVEGLGGVKSKQKRKIRGGVLIGKNYCLKLKVFLPLMTRIMLLKTKARLLWSQKLEHAKDKKISRCEPEDLDSNPSLATNMI